mgnify:CR=1 FL=1
MEGAITRKQIAGITIEIQETRIGDDIVLILAGGDKPHIGCVVQAVCGTFKRSGRCGCSGALQR